MTGQPSRKLDQIKSDLAAVARMPTRLATYLWWLALFAAVAACCASALRLNKELHRRSIQEIADAVLVQTATRDHDVLIQLASPQNAFDFTATLPSSTYIVDDELRFTSRLCNELHVTLVSMTADAEVRHPHALGRIRIRLQIRGPYVALSMASAGLLDKFPGLVVLRTHIQASKDAGNLNEGATEDQQLELLQFTKPDEVPT